MKNTLWTRDYSLLIGATVLGAAGGIAGSFALSFLVYDETGSTFAAALLIAIRIVPGFFLPLIAGPILDRLPRKVFLVGGDAVDGALYALMGLYLLFRDFSYTGYLAFSLLLSCLGVFDQLAYESIYPSLIPAGFTEKGYTVSSMLYPVVQVVMTPLAAVALRSIGVGRILLVQGALSIAAALLESRIRVRPLPQEDAAAPFSLRTWAGDLREAALYLKSEPGLRAIYGYMAFTNGAATGASPLLVAFFRTAPGFTAAMYSFFSAAEFLGRTVGGLLHYFVRIPEKRRFSFAFFVYQCYEAMDACLLWLPYPLMLANRAVCGFLGVNSAALRQAAVQRYIPERLRARLAALSSVLSSCVYCVLTLAIGALGELLPAPVCLTVCGLTTSAVCFATVFRRRASVRAIYNAPDAA